MSLFVAFPVHEQFCMHTSKRATSMVQCIVCIKSKQIQGRTNTKQCKLDGEKKKTAACNKVFRCTQLYGCLFLLCRKIAPGKNRMDVGEHSELELNEYVCVSL